MKIVWRILIILFAGLLVSGVVYGITKTSLAAELIGGPGGDFEGERLGGENSRPDFEGAPPNGGFNRQGHNDGHHGDDSGGWDFHTTIKNLEVIGAIIAGVVLVSLLWNQGQKLYRRFRARQAVTENASV